MTTVGRHDLHHAAGRHRAAGEPTWWDEWKWVVISAVVAGVVFYTMMIVWALDVFSSTTPTP